MKIEIGEFVIHSSYGGFRVSLDMAMWLVENRGWKVVSKSEWDYDTKLPVCDLIDYGGDHFSPPSENDSTTFRSNPDLIACVLAIQAAHADDSFTDRYYRYENGLRIVKMYAEVGIENYNDGHERVTVHCGDYR